MNRPLREWRQAALGLALGLLLLGSLPDLLVLHRDRAGWITLILGLACLGWAAYLNGRIRREGGRK